MSQEFHIGDTVCKSKDHVDVGNYYIAVVSYPSHGVMLSTTESRRRRQIVLINLYLGGSTVVLRPARMVLTERVINGELSG